MTLNFTADAAARLLAAAARAGFPTSPVIGALRLYIETFLARRHRGLPAPPSRPLPPELAAWRNELHRLGNNLNQAVHLAHATRAGLPSQTPVLLRELIELLRSVEARLLALVADAR